LFKNIDYLLQYRINLIDRIIKPQRYFQKKKKKKNLIDRIIKPQRYFQKKKKKKDSTLPLVISNCKLSDAHTFLSLQ